MAKVYAALIVKGIRTLTQVPEIIREQTKEVLKENGYETLADE